MRTRMYIALVVYIFAVVECRSDSIDVKDDTLLGWPRDFSGVAVVPYGVKHIGLGAFAHCETLTGVVFPCSLETIGPFAFSGCMALHELRVPHSVTNIGESAFYNCWSLTNLSLQASITKIPNDLCVKCLKLRNVDIPTEVVEVGDGAFSGCRSIRLVKMPDAIARVGRNSFAGCSRLRCVDLPNELEYIGENAFYCCYDLKYLFVHSPIDLIGMDLFRNCFSLKGCVVSVPIVTALGEDSSSGEICQYVVYSFPDGDGPALGNESGAKRCWRRTGSYGSAGEAIVAIDRMGSAAPNRLMFEGLAEALKVGADGLIETDPNLYKVAFKLDAFSANMYRLCRANSADEQKKYFIRYSSTSVDNGDKLIANFDFSGKISMVVEFAEGKISGLILSSGLKDAMRKGMEIGNAEKSDKLIKWMSGM